MSSDRILVSHVGSLPRSPTLSGPLIGQEAGETVDAAALAHEVESATAHVINEQVAAILASESGRGLPLHAQFVARCVPESAPCGWMPRADRKFRVSERPAGSLQ
jgi:hypothetical protein